jgi:small nuclear ribonucleoprotein D3
MSSGIPVKLLFDSVGTIVSAELMNGDLYRGRLTNIEDNMNMQLDDTEITTRGGQKTTQKSVFLRGSSVVFLQLPDLLKTSPALLTALTELTAAADNRGNKGGFGAGRFEGKPKKRSRDE